MRKIVNGVMNILKKKEKLIIEKEEIKKILPHRDRMLLLDKVIITEKKLSGIFNVTEEVCKGHSAWDGKDVLKGSDLFDMAAQLIGVWAYQNPDLSGKTCVVRKYGSAKFTEVIFPSNILTMELDTEKIKATILLGKKDQTIFITGEGFSALVSGKIRAQISFVELFAF